MTHKIKETIVEQGAVGLGEATRITSIGRTRLYELMNSKQLKYILIGKRRLIPRSELTRLLADNLVGV